MILAEFIRNTAFAVEVELKRILVPPGEREQQLYAAMCHSVFAGGKRLRPALFCATLQAFGVEPRPYLPFAAALEMIHTYSLIHDDLPAMDNDDFRRGKPTCHKVYGESLAILAGDGLLTQAFAVMAEQQGDAHRVLKAIKVVSQQAGLLGMVAGQAADVACAGQEIDEDLLRYIYRGKTAALFAASILSAAYLAGAGQEKLVVLEQYSTLLGYAFQITDDVLDIRGDAALLGKPLGSDAKNAKTTFATLLGCDQAIVYADALAKQAGDVLADFGADAELLRQMPGYLCGRTK